MVPTNAYSKYHASQFFPLSPFSNNFCLACDTFFVGRVAIIFACGCLFHPWCMWQVLGGARNGGRTCPRCETKTIGSWVAQWGLLSTSSKDENEHTNMLLYQ